MCPVLCRNGVQIQDPVPPIHLNHLTYDHCDFGSSCLWNNFGCPVNRRHNTKYRYANITLSINANSSVYRGHWLTDTDHDHFTWYCSLIVGMSLLMISNVILMVGALYRKSGPIKQWLYVHLIVIIAELHLLVMDLLVQKISSLQGLLLTTSATLWTIIFYTLVYRVLRRLQMENSNTPALLVNEGLWWWIEVLFILCSLIII